MLAMLALGCTAPSLSTFAAGAVLITAPAPYQHWWQLTEQCSGQTGDLSSVQWYVIRQPTLSLGDTSYDGFWYVDGNRIVIAQPYLLNGQTVRHELLHALLHTGSHRILNDRSSRPA